MKASKDNRRVDFPEADFGASTMQGVKDKRGKAEK